MESRHKKIKILDKEFKLDYSIKENSFIIQKEEILNAGKVNHRIHGTFVVKQGNRSKLTVKCFILTVTQLVEWAEYFHVSHNPLFVNPAKSTATNPPNDLYSSKEAISQGNFDLNVEKESILYFVLDNRFSTLTLKNVQLTIWEEWDESILPIDVVTTTPPEDTSIEETIRKLILSAKNDLKILSPYVDMYFIKTIREQYDKGIQISMVTRGINEKSHSRENKQALTFIQEKLGDSHRINPHIHSRIIICDEINALVSSADLTESSLKSHYNAGIILSDPTLVQKILNYFNQAFKDSKPMGRT